MSIEIVTPENRLKVIAVMAKDVFEDIYSGKYNTIGRPNITSIQHAASLPAEDWEHAIDEFRVFLERYDQIVGECQ
ncbi:hypothetical protein [Photobacterium salinisoli]|uniref:hypothetical protein n=1 Tax=Photobacterium salinisoli TaxID=1616783 RepID=UPI000EA19B8A|nr:hypothetical protein [Photobacterium salinisoli]